MKTRILNQWITAIMAAGLLFGGSRPTCGWYGKLNYPHVAFFAHTDPQHRDGIIKVLTAKPKEFLDGESFHTTTILRYTGNTVSLNQFLSGLAVCPGVRMQIKFNQNLGYQRNVGEAAWAVCHTPLKAGGSHLVITVNPASKLIDLEQLEIPEIRTAPQEETDQRPPAAPSR